MEKIKVGDVFKTNTSGLLKVVEYLHCNKILVEFESGNRVYAASGNIRAGKVRDHDSPSKGRSKHGDIELGKYYDSKDFGKFEIIDYKSSSSIFIKFTTTGTVKKVTAAAIRSGSIKDEMLPYKYGKGFVGIGEYTPTIDGKQSKPYRIWSSMMARAYSDSYKSSFPTYQDVTVCADWHNFQVFAEWCNSQKFYHFEGYVLEKDILKRGNKTYCPEFCRFVPPSLNSLITKCDANRGNLPIGVSWCSTKELFHSCVNRDGVTEFIGYYNCPVKAFGAYKKRKEEIIKEMADRFKNKIDEDIYSSLYSYEVLITD